jgi:hypothetical protein
MTLLYLKCGRGMSVYYVKSQYVHIILGMRKTSHLYFQELKSKFATIFLL